MLGIIFMLFSMILFTFDLILIILFGEEIENNDQALCFAKIIFILGIISASFALILFRKESQNNQILMDSFTFKIQAEMQECSAIFADDDW